jgi:hypothetical protein
VKWTEDRITRTGMLTAKGREGVGNGDSGWKETAPHSSGWDSQWPMVRKSPVFPIVCLN